jgi:hypothetical protein
MTGKGRFQIDNRRASKRVNCPLCKGRRSFTPYYDAITGKQLPEQYGICTRLNKCGHHFSPWHDEYARNILRAEKREWAGHESPKEFLARIRTRPAETAILGPKKEPAGPVPRDIFKGSLQGLNSSGFTLFLKKVFGQRKAAQIVSKYFIGAKPGFVFKNQEFPGYLSPEGANIFWRISYAGKPHSGKVMLYDPETGKRVKFPFDHVNWVHILYKLGTEEPMKYFFGEHLLRLFPGRPVMIHESEKTACIASGHLPEYIHLACGGLGMLTRERCEVLKGRQVILCPDLDGFEKWEAKAKELGFRLFTLHKERAVQAGLHGLKFDLADFLLNIPFTEKQEAVSIQEQPFQAQEEYIPAEEEPFPAEEPTLPVILGEYQTEEGFILAKIKYPNGNVRKVLFDVVGIPLNSQDNPETLKRLFTLFGFNFKEEPFGGTLALQAPCLEIEPLGLNWDPVIEGLKSLPLFRHQITLPNGFTLKDPSIHIRQLIFSVNRGNGSEGLFQDAVFILQTVQASPYLVISHRDKDYKTLINQKIFKPGSCTYEFLKNINN